MGKTKNVLKKAEMKNPIIILLSILMLTTTFLNAESDEWGAWFRTSMEKSKENQMEPEIKQWSMERWKNEKDKLISDYKKFLKRDIKGEVAPLNEADCREQIVNLYYYDNTDPEINRIVDFYIYVLENDPQKTLRHRAIEHLTTIALEDNIKAKSYIISQKNNTSLPHRLNLQFHLAYLTLQEDQHTLDYLMSLIKKAQEVETTNLKYSSPDEGAIAGYLNQKYFSRRYRKGLDYETVLPLIKQIIFSRSVNAQRTACLKYYYQTNRAEMRKIYDDCWAKVQDENTQREEYLNALYGLQALYGLSQRNIGKYKIGFKGILIYFETLILKTPTKDGLIYVDSGKETRISKEEKRYFQKRLRSK